MNGTYSQENVDLILQQFAFTCRTFTNVMAIKHQLQYSLFNGSYYTEKNETLAKVNSKEIKNFTLIMEYLQMLGSILQSIEVCAWLYMKLLYSSTVLVIHFCFFQKTLTGKHCTKFSASQYEIIYWSLITDNNISVLNTLQNVRWAVTAEYPDEWFNDSDHSPSHHRCTQ